MDEWEILNLQTIRYIKSGILKVLNYVFGSDTVATSYLVGSNEKTHNIPV